MKDLEILEKLEFVCPSIKSDASAMFLKNQMDKYYFRSGLDFLVQHNGYRPKNIHLVIGPAGAGKSSLLFAQIFDLIKFNSKTLGDTCKIGLYLSEEKIERFKNSLVKMGLYGAEKSKLTDFLSCFSEKEFKMKNNILKLHGETIIKILREFIKRENIKILFIDNLTTTDPYLDDRHEEISPMAKQLSSLADEFNIPIVIYAHTKGEVNGPDFTMEDIRQKKTITNLAEFVYLVHRFNSTEIPSFLQTRKYRGYPIKNYFHQLTYNKDMGIVAGMMGSSLSSYRMKLKEYREIGKNGI